MMTTNEGLPPLLVLDDEAPPSAARFNPDRRTTIVRVPGYTIAAQHWRKNGAWLAVRITTDTGEQLDHLDRIPHPGATMKESVAHTLTRLVGDAFGTDPTQTVLRQAGAALEGIWQAAQQLVGQHGNTAEVPIGRLALACAACQIPADRVAQYRAALGLGDMGDHLLRVEEAHAFRSVGYGPDDVAAWMANADRFSIRAFGLTVLTVVAGFARTGWDPDHLDAVRAECSDQAAVDALAPLLHLPPRLALLAVRAGLAPAEARDLHHQGLLDEGTLAALAALRT